MADLVFGGAWRGSHNMRGGGLMTVSLVPHACRDYWRRQLWRSLLWVVERHASCTEG